MVEKCTVDLVPLAIAIFLAAIVFSASFALATPKTVVETKLIPSTTERNYLNVNAQAVEEVTPDKVEIVFSVVSKGEDPAKIQIENDEKVRKIKEKLMAIGVPEQNIKTVGYNLDKLYEWNKTLEKSVDIGYSLTNSIRVVSYQTALGANIVKESVANGANDISSVQFMLSDKTREEVYARLLEEACKNAGEKAQSMARASDAKIKRLAGMNEGYSYVEPTANVDYRYAKMEYAAQDSAGGSVSLSAGTAKVSVSVSASYELE